MEMNKDIDNQLLAKLDEMTPALLRSLRILDPRGPAGLDITLNQFFVLSLLSRKETFLMGELAREMGTSSGNMTTMINRLIQSGLVLRERSKKDRRVVLVKLSPSGKELADRVRRFTKTGMRRIMKKIPDKQKYAFFETLSTIIKAISENPPKRRKIRILKKVIKKAKAKNKPI